jgi:peptidoglycan/xylan/chitin deacetylase (PgdA/CDA1 family)
MNAEPQSPAWRWSEERIRTTVGRVRAGRPLLSDRADSPWPNGARAAVALSFDADHETPALRDGLTSPGKMAQGEYGARVGVPRILALLEEHRIPATFFIPAICAVLRPDEAPEYIARGHEVGVHGWIHERNSLLDADEEFDLTRRSLDILEAQTGIRPCGIRTPSWDFSSSTLQIIRDLGFRYDSSLMADDDPYELLQDGVGTGVVEIPVEWLRDDVPYLSTDMAAASRPNVTPMSLVSIWQAEFDGAYADGGVFQLTMHPHIIGHRSRMVALKALIEHIRAHENVWFATHAELAAHVGTGLVRTANQKPSQDTSFRSEQEH